MILPTPWFQRRFVLIEDIGVLPSIIERLAGTPIRLHQKIKSLPENVLTQSLQEKKWTIQEQVGHLQQIEPVWLGRMQDILTGKEFLREADLTNQATFDAQYNLQHISDILQQFHEDRTQLVAFLEKVDPQEVIKSALHPRLKTPMRMIDLAFFVAEHDDHHLATISYILKTIE